MPDPSISQALAPLPSSGRTGLDLDLIGRDTDVEWLETTDGDRLVTGQPGSGKTHLLRHFAKQEWGVFLRTDDWTAVREALLDQRPNVVIVDDAHVDLKRIRGLRDLRDETRMDFAIVATSWEGGRDAVVEALGSLPAESIRRLELLTRDQIVEVIRLAGVRANDDVVRFLVDQSANKPGLAVTLATLCLRGSWDEVLTGEALARSLMVGFKALVGPESVELLAVLGIGGERGMALETARDYLGIDMSKARRLATDLALGGVLSEVKGEPGVLAVSPVALRSALIRRNFFEGPAPLDYRPLVERAPSFESAVRALVTARAYGAEIPDGELRGLLERCPVPEEWQLAFRRATEVWSHYAALGESAARWVLEHYPGDVMHVVAAALGPAPEAAIPRWLECAASDESRDQLHELGVWMRDLEAEQRDSGESLRRRKLAARLAREYTEDGGDRRVAAEVVLMALSAGLSRTSSDPGMGRMITTTQGFLPLAQLQQLEVVWEEGRGAIDGLDSAVWSLVRDAAWEWAYPDTAAPGLEIGPEARDAIRRLGKRVLTDLAPLARDSVGLTAGLVRLASKLGLPLELPLDPVFELLYPPDWPDPGADGDGVATRALEDLAERWLGELSPEGVARELGRYEAEAQWIVRQGRLRTVELCAMLAAGVANPVRWVEAFLETSLNANLVRPFLEATVKSRPAGWDELLGRCLELESTSWDALRLILTAEDVPPGLLSAALERAPDQVNLVEIVSLRQEVPREVLGRLLKHPDSKTALAAAIGEWRGGSEGQVAEAVVDVWRQAILRSAACSDVHSAVSLDHGLSGILAQDPRLAFEWLRLFLAEGPSWEPFATVAFPVRSAINALTEDQRLSILDSLEAGRAARLLLPLLVGRSPVVYARLLEIDALRDHHLTPLGGKPDAEWAELARLALDKGHDPGAVATACLTGNSLSGDGYVGDGKDYWAAWERAFEVFESHEHDGLRAVARQGQAHIRERAQAAAARYRQLQLEGIGG